MILHTKLTIKKNDNIWVLYNSLLPGIFDSIATFKPYASYLAYGTGSSETDLNQNNLEKFTGVIKLETKEYNFNPLNGDMFLTKKLDIQEDDPNFYAFSEFGLTGYPDEENPIVVNRFLTSGGEQIYRDPGEKMEMEVSIFLSGVITDGSISLTAGDNLLIASFLGEEVVGVDNTFIFGLAKGLDTTPNTEIIERSYTGAINPASFSFVLNDDMSIGFSISGAVGTGKIKEILVLFKGSVVLRSAIISQGEDVGGVVVVKADQDSVITLNYSEVAETVPITNISSGETVTPTGTKMFATSFLKVISNPFGEGFNFNNYEKVLNYTGNWVLFYEKSNFTKHLFRITGEDVKLCNTSRIDFTNAVSVTLSDDCIIIKKQNPDTGAYDVSNYWYDEDDDYFVSKTYYLAIAGMDSGKNIKWNNFKIVKSSTSNAQYVFMEHNYFYVIMYHVNSSYGSLNSRRYDYLPSLEDNISVSVVGGATHRYNAWLAGYNHRYNRVDYVQSAKSRRSTTNEVAMEIFTSPKYNDFPKLGKNFIMTFDKVARKLILFNLVSLTGSYKELPEAKDVFISDNFDYLAVRQDDNTIKFYFVDADFKLIPFKSNLESMLDTTSVEEIVFVKGAALLFMEGGTTCYMAVMNEDRRLFYGLNPGDEYMVNLDAGSLSDSIETVANIGVGLSVSEGD